MNRRFLIVVAVGFLFLTGHNCSGDSDHDHAGPGRTGKVPGDAKITSYPVPAGSFPHDVAPAADGGVWYTAQHKGELGHLDPATGQTYHVELGSGSSPHGVIVGPDKAPWVTDTGLNAIVRVDPATREVTRFQLPAGSPNVGLHTATFAGDGALWFTGNNGYFGRLLPPIKAGSVAQVFPAPGGAGPYGITAVPSGDVYFASLARSYVAQVNPENGDATVLMPPTPDQGARRVWSDSHGRVWVSEWNAGQLAMFEPSTKVWREWKLPGERPQAYAVYVDEHDRVWLSDFGANSLVMFEPVSEKFHSFPLPSSPSNVRQILGRPGEIWGAESAADKLVVIRGA